jgi:hypothetical protein
MDAAELQIRCNVALDTRLPHSLAAPIAPTKKATHGVAFFAATGHSP